MDTAGAGFCFVVVFGISGVEASDIAAIVR